MRFKKNYTDNSDVMRLIMEDCSGRKISSFRIGVQDKKAMASVFRAINEEYGLGLLIQPKDGYANFDEKYHL